jgi:hypothetical protein
VALHREVFQVLSAGAADNKKNADMARKTLLLPFRVCRLVPFQVWNRLIHRLRVMPQRVYLCPLDVIVALPYRLCIHRNLAMKQAHRPCIQSNPLLHHRTPRNTPTIAEELISMHLVSHLGGQTLSMTVTRCIPHKEISAHKYLTLDRHRNIPNHSILNRNIPNHSIQKHSRQDPLVVSPQIRHRLGILILMSIPWIPIPWRYRQTSHQGPYPPTEVIEAMSLAVVLREVR